MKQVDNILGILLGVEIYCNSEKHKKNKEKLDKYLKEHGKPINSVKNEKSILTSS